MHGEILIYKEGYNVISVMDYFDALFDVSDNHPPNVFSLLTLEGLNELISGGGLACFLVALRFQFIIHRAWE